MTDNDWMQISFWVTSLVSLCNGTIMEN